MQVSTLIAASLRKIGGLSSGETIETTRQTEALYALQSMLRSWGAVSNYVFASVKESTTLTAGTATYTWGSGGAINSARPNQLIGAYILDSGSMTHPVDIISEGEYRTITDKTTSSRPDKIFLYPAFPLSTLYLHPVPSATETLYLDSYKPFTESSSFTLTTDEIDFPLYYEEPIIYNLAIRLAPEYGKSASVEVALIAKSSLDFLMILHAAGKVEPVFVLIPANAPYGAGYSINSDSYH